MDGVVSPAMAAHMGKLGGLAVLNLEGIWTRYDDPAAELARIAELPPSARRPRCSASTPLPSSPS